jgi:hypothetical protein
MEKLARWSYPWFSVGETRELCSGSADAEAYDGNFVALPEEKLVEFDAFIAEA